MPRALLLTGDAAEELDTMYPYYRVQEGGWDVDVSSRTTRDVQLVIHEFDPNSDAYVEKNGRKLPVDVPWAEVDVERYDASSSRGRAPSGSGSTPTSGASPSTSSRATSPSRWSATAHRCQRCTGC
ncbi:DJ-1/PfpI family protein [Micromonospora sp. M12]